MAKGKKHSIALFEVIQANRKTRTGGSSLSTPKWWFKKRDAAKAKMMTAPRSESAIATLPPPPLVPAALEPQNIDAAPKDCAPKAEPASRSAAVDLAVDPDRQRISFHFTYTSAIIVAFSAIVCVSLAYIVGHTRQGPSMALAGPTIEQVKSAPVNPAVLNVNNAPLPAGNSKKNIAAAAAAPLTNYFDREEIRKAAPNTPVANVAAPAADVTTSPSGERVRGLNYLIAQSWPDTEQQQAYDVCAQLNKAGIAVTVEKNVPGYLMPRVETTYSVVTLHGYARISDPNYVATEKAILAMNDKLGKNSKFKGLEPKGKKW